MIEWKEVAIGDLGKVVTGNTPPKRDPENYGGKYPFIKPTDMTVDQRYVFNFDETYSEKAFTRYQRSYIPPLSTGVVTIGTVGEKLFLSHEWCFTNQSVNVIIPDKNMYDNMFIYYLMKYSLPKVSKANPGTASGRHHVSKSNFCSIKVNVPPLGEQQKIASILASYDDLIENNNHRIIILENMAQKLYSEWFVKFHFPGYEDVKMVESELGLIPEEWDVVKLSDIAKVNPESITVRTAPETIKYVDISSVGTGKIDNLKEMLFSEAPSRARRKVSHQDIIWATVRPNRKQYAYIVNPEENTIVSTGFAVIRAEKVPSSYLYFAVTTDNYVSYLVNNASGSAYPAVNAGEFNNSDIIKPTSELLQQYAEIVDPLLLLIKILSMKNRNLKKQRDLLLPKLISGKINV